MLFSSEDMTEMQCVRSFVRAFEGLLVRGRGWLVTWKLALDETFLTVEANSVLLKFYSEEQAEKDMNAVVESLDSDQNQDKSSIKEIFKPALRLVITIGLVVGILQQITGINSVFFYAPMIFEQSGIGTDASFIQAILLKKRTRRSLSLVSQSGTA